MDEIALILGIQKPHAHFAKAVVLTKSELKHKIKELKSERDKLIQAHEHKRLHQVRRQIHEYKTRIRRIEQQSASGD
jgi:phage shock protein A